MKSLRFLSVTAGWPARKLRFRGSRAPDVRLRVFIFLTQCKQADGAIFVHDLTADAPQIRVG